MWAICTAIALPLAFFIVMHFSYKIVLGIDLLYIIAVGVSDIILILNKIIALFISIFVKIIEQCSCDILRDFLRLFIKFFKKKPLFKLSFSP